MGRKNRRAPAGRKATGKGRPAQGGSWKRRTFLTRSAQALSLPAREVEERLTGGLASSVRLNRIRVETPDAAEAAWAALADFGELTPIPWCPDAVFFEGDKHELTRSAWFQEGRIYVQNASSLVPALALDVAAGQRILDVCAAPGGKSAHIAALTGNGAELWLNDGLPARLPKLREVVALHGVDVHELCCVPGQYLDKELEGPFDRILLDAQCSGEGMVDLRRGDALKHWSLGRVEKHRRLQQRMLMAAWRVLKPGGLLVYSTCTLAPEENEAPVSHLLRHREDAAVEPVELEVDGRRRAVLEWPELKLDRRVSGALRLAPSRWHEGFFVCRLRKRG